MIATENKNGVAVEHWSAFATALDCVGRSLRHSWIPRRICASQFGRPPAIAGDLHFVNPKRPVIHGKQCFGSIEELPPNVDCAVLAIPGTAVLPSVRSCAENGVCSLIVFSAGFAEGGADG